MTISAQVFSYILSSLFMLGFGWFSGKYSEYYSGKDMRDSYVGLNIPSWAPPGYLFGIVWTTLYILMGIGLSQIIYSTSEKSLLGFLDLKAFLIVWFVLQYAINFAWSIAAAGFNQIEKSKWLTLILAIFVIAMTVVSFIAGNFGFLDFSSSLLHSQGISWLSSNIPALCFLPYAIWSSFATFLHWTIASLNPGK